jgi:DNA repair photolyase
MSRFGHRGEPWGTFVDVKSNAPERLEKEIKRKQKGIVLLSSVTDPYQPLEKRFNITRKCLEILVDHQFPIEILTKSDLLLRDIDLLEKLDFCEVGYTLATVNEAHQRIFEPSASPIESRLNALGKLNEIGLQTYAFLGPILPISKELEIEELLDLLADRVGRVIVDRLNIKYGNSEPLKKAISDHYPPMKKHFQKAVETNSQYYGNIKKRIKELCRYRNIPCDIVY